MNTELNQPACITIRFREKRYLLCADEVTNFMINCEQLGFNSPAEIAAAIIAIVKYIPPADTRSAQLLQELSESMQACVFADS